MSPPGSPNRKYALRQPANTLDKQRKLAEAAELREEGTKDLVPGEEDIDGALQLAELSSTYRSQSKRTSNLQPLLARSVALAKQGLDAVIRLKGRQSPEAALVMEILALIENRLGNTQRALHLGQEVLQTRSSIFGAESPHTLDAMENIGVHLMNLGDHDRAIGIYEAVLEIKMRVYGPIHPETLFSERKMTRCWRVHGDVAKSRRAGEDILRRAVRVFGEDHFEAHQAAVGLWKSMIAQGQIEEADDLEKRHKLVLNAENRGMRRNVSPRPP